MLHLATGYTTAEHTGKGWVGGWVKGGGGMLGWVHGRVNKLVGGRVDGWACGLAKLQFSFIVVGRLVGWLVGQR